MTERENKNTKFEAKQSLKRIAEEYGKDVRELFFNPTSFEHIIRKGIFYLDGIQKCTELFYEKAVKEGKKRTNSLLGEAKNSLKQLSVNPVEELDNDTFFKIIYTIENFRYQFENASRINPSKILLNSLFLNCFSIYDAFLGDLLHNIFKRKIDLLKSSSKSVSYETIIEFDDIDDLQQYIIADEIDKIRRESYIKQFKLLEERFGIHLKKFKRWSDFVECGQRRNIVMHCDGIVTDQYLTNCNGEGIKPTGQIGNKLKVDLEYLNHTIMVLSELIFMLGQTLWRKQFDSELEKADSQIINYQYELLTLQKWELCKRIGEFAYNLPRHFSDEKKKVITINYCGALKFNGERRKAEDILNRTDWSSSIHDLKLAKCVLLEDYDEAIEFCRKIGQEGDYINKKSYLEWPIFKEFRKTKQLKDVFEEIYNEKLEDQIKGNLKETIESEIKNLQE